MLKKMWLYVGQYYNRIIYKQLYQNSEHENPTFDILNNNSYNKKSIAKVQCHNVFA